MNCINGILRNLLVGNDQPYFTKLHLRLNVKTFLHVFTHSCINHPMMTKSLRLYRLFVERKGVIIGAEQYYQCYRTLNDITLTLTFPSNFVFTYQSTRDYRTFYNPQNRVICGRISSKPIWYI